MSPACRFRIEEQEHGLIKFEEHMALAFFLVRLVSEKSCIELPRLVEVRRVKRGFQNTAKFHPDAKVAQKSVSASSTPKITGEFPMPLGDAEQTRAAHVALSIFVRTAYSPHHFNANRP